MKMIRKLNSMVKREKVKSLVVIVLMEAIMMFKKPSMKVKNFAK